VLSVANSGDPVAPDEVARLFQPFQRLGAERTDHGDGVGLGLSIVQAIATAHDATVVARARAGGGLDIEIGFPRLDARPNDAAYEPEPVTLQEPAPPAGRAV
jgi:signal transduction histidine kinase